MLRDMRVQTHLKPGQKGTKQLVEKYGDALICVRYRYDRKRRVYLKTAELIEQEWGEKPLARYRDGDIVPVIVAYAEKQLREKLKAAGGRWDPEEKLWRVPYGAIRGDVELEERILLE